MTIFVLVGSRYTSWIDLNYRLYICLAQYAFLQSRQKEEFYPYKQFLRRFFTDQYYFFSTYALSYAVVDKFYKGQSIVSTASNWSEILY